MERETKTLHNYLAMIISIISIGSALVAAIIVAIDTAKNPQPIKSLRAIWILSALWSSVFGLAAYIYLGRVKHRGDGQKPLSKWQKVVVSTFHCGAGCTVADLLGAAFLQLVPIEIIVSSLLGRWSFNYMLSLCFGTFFQFNTIKLKSPLLTKQQLLRRAITVNILSMSVWKIGVYSWLYIVIFRLHFIKSYSIPTWDFWFGLQQAMMVGFLLALPVNYLLIRYKIKV